MEAWYPKKIEKVAVEGASKKAHYLHINRENRVGVMYLDTNDWQHMATHCKLLQPQHSRGNVDFEDGQGRQEKDHRAGAHSEQALSNLSLTSVWFRLRVSSVFSSK